MSDIKRRGGHRAIVSRVISEIKCLLLDTTANDMKIKLKIKSLQGQKEKIDSLDEKIQCELDGDDLLQDMDEAFEISSNIEEIIMEAENQIKNEKKEDCNSATRNRNIKLPTLVLPVFSGDPTEWVHFWDTFRTAVDVRDDLSGANKFSYLVGQLDGEAKQLLEGFTTTDSHYIEAISLLKETYGKPNKIVQAHVNAILDLNAPKSSANGLSQFRASYECHLRGLKTLNIDVEAAGFILVIILIRKLPNKIKNNICRATKADLWTLSIFRESIENEIEMLRISDHEDKTDETHKSVKEVRSYGDFSQKTKSTAGTFNVATTKNEKRCRFCKSLHKEIDCVKYNSAALRYERAKELNLCFNCLLDNHRVRSCMRNLNCKYCRGWHHFSLCYRDSKGKKNNDDEKIEKETLQTTTVSSIKQIGCRSQSVALPTAMLPIKARLGLVKVRALFDQGSQKTFILRSLVTKYKLNIDGRINLRIDGFQSIGSDQTYDIATFEVRTHNKNILVEAVVVENLPSRLEVPGIAKVINNLKCKEIYLADPLLQSDIIEGVSVLIGADQFYNFVHGHRIVDKLHLINSVLGTMISGPIPNSGLQDKSVAADVITVLKASVTETNSLDECIQKIWSMDSIGMDRSIAQNEVDVMEDFHRNIAYEDGRYTVKLPWKNNHVALPTNYGMAKGRLTSTLNRLRRNPDHLSFYNSIIQEQVKKGFIEKINMSEKASIDSKIHYLAHHGVKKDSPTTPLRIVYDCSAGNPSLNQCLYTGPPLLNDLGHVILRFRLGKFACVSDIAKAYHMIGLHKADRDSTRFLWPENPSENEGNINTYRFKVVLFGATCSQFLLNATIVFHLRANKCETALNIERNIYVDNLQGTFENENQVMQFYRKSKNLMHKAGFHLREWTTNSILLQAEIVKNEDGNTSPTSHNTKLLGMYWNTFDDTLSFPYIKFDIREPEEFTKRYLVSHVAKVFDPLGIIAPVTISSRILIQDVWRSKCNWDQMIEEPSLYERWKTIASNIEKAMTVKIPRRLHIKGVLSLHVFSDASARAYGAVVYASNSVKTQLIIAKARVAPLKNLTIPKLELTAAAVGAHLISYVLDAYSQELEFSLVYFWIDSQVALHWITGMRKLTQFVQNRVNNIRLLCGQAEFRYVPTSDNPADFLSKGISAEKLSDSSLWNHGPVWLTEKENWPKNEWNNERSEEISKGYFVCNVAETKQDNFIMMIERFSSLKKLLHVTSLALRFIELLKGHSDRKCSLNAHDVSVEEINEAENFWINKVQHVYYHEEIEYLKIGKGKTPNLVLQLNLFNDQGVVKCKTRLKHANIASSAKVPILLPSKCTLTKLIILDAHSKTFHGGTAIVIDRIRQRFWIPCLRQKVKTILRSCLLCRKIHGRAYASPSPPPLPITRVEERRPFSVTGVDYTGALIVKNGKQENKVYIALFTCSITRAIHLELVSDNSCESFIRAFRRFVARRSCPRIMMSDNSTTFKAASRFLEELHKEEKMKAILTENRCEWRFIPSRAPWFGGYWERLIGLTKMSIKKVLGRAFVNIEEMQTLIVEVEGIINDRPLTQNSDSIHDLDALTPSQLLYGHCIGGLPDQEIEMDEDFMNPSLLTARQKRCEKLRQHLWKRWHSEYLFSLRERHFEKLKNTPRNKYQSIRVNDLDTSSFNLFKVFSIFSYFGLVLSNSFLISITSLAR